MAVSGHQGGRELLGQRLPHPVPLAIERPHDTVALAPQEVSIPKGQGMLGRLLGSASSGSEGRSLEGLWAVTPGDLSPDGPQLCSPGNFLVFRPGQCIMPSPRR